jgi:hypothetical protein
MKMFRSFKHALGPCPKFEELTKHDKIEDGFIYYTVPAYYLLKIDGRLHFWYASEFSTSLLIGTYKNSNYFGILPVGTITVLCRDT